MQFMYCNGNSYVVEPGDTLYSISRKFNIPVSEIIRTNHGYDIYNLLVGMELCIPKNGSRYVENLMAGFPNYDLANETFYIEYEEQMEVQQEEEGDLQEQEPFQQPMQQPMRQPMQQPMQQPMREERNMHRGNRDFDQIWEPGSRAVAPQNETNGQGVPMVVISYVVEKEESLKDILERFGIKLSDIEKYNDLSKVKLLPGSTIKVLNARTMDEEKYES